MPAGTRLGDRVGSGRDRRARSSCRSPQPRVVVVTVGDELVDTTRALTAGLVHDSVSVMLTASGDQAGATTFRGGPSRRDEATLARTIEDQLVRADLIVVVGEDDGESEPGDGLVASALKAAGCEDLEYCQQSPDLQLGSAPLAKIRSRWSRSEERRCLLSSGLKLPSARSLPPSLVASHCFAQLFARISRMRLPARVIVASSFLRLSVSIPRRRGRSSLSWTNPLTRPRCGYFARTHWSSPGVRNVTGSSRRGGSNSTGPRMISNAPTPTLSCGPIGLRSIRLRDGNAWRTVRNRNRAWLTPWDATSPMGSVDVPPTFAAMARSLRAEARAGRTLPWVITYQDRLIGQLTVGGIAYGSLRSAHAGYWVDQQFAGHGIAPTAVALGADYCFFGLGLHRVEINLRPENAASRRVVENSASDMRASVSVICTLMARGEIT